MPKPGEEPINGLDELALLHDIEYSHISKNKGKISKKEYMDNIHEADRKFIEETKTVKGTPITASIARKMIELKLLAEKNAILPMSVFSGAGAGKLDFESVDMCKMCRCMNFPSDNLIIASSKGIKQKGGFLPALMALGRLLLTTVGPIVLEKIGSYIGDKIKGGAALKGSGIIDKDVSENILRKRIVEKLELMGPVKMVNILHKAIGDTPTHLIFPQE
jgi:hypothetical protein